MRARQASQILFDEEGREYLSDFLDAVRLGGHTMASGEEIPGTLRERLILDYPEDVKRLIVEKHNLYNASRTR